MQFGHDLDEDLDRGHMGGLETCMTMVLMYSILNTLEMGSDVQTDRSRETFTTVISFFLVQCRIRLTLNPIMDFDVVSHMLQNAYYSSTLPAFLSWCIFADSLHFCVLSGSLYSMLQYDQAQKCTSL